MKLDLLENGFRKMKLELENEIGNIGKWNQKHWKMLLGKLENVIGNIGKYICKWASEIGFVGKWNEKH